MFISIDRPEYQNHAHLMREMFILRKRVFHDMLRWDVQVEGDIERDRYDDLGPSYLVWCDPGATTIYASLRMLPTTGPTLLFDVFHQTAPNIATLSAPSIWEATRSCVHAENLARDFPHISQGKAFGLLMLAMVEWSVRYGIDTVIGNYEPRVSRLYDRAGMLFDELGRADGFGEHPVCCGAFEMSERVLQRMRAKQGVAASVFHAGGNALRAA
ncbi:acyl-homoserine-lactone synthase [Chelativorans sp.]|uniref:acyl-homoserine-lactone synthase n=1 Tax=Chelativorans sp. TaxID=2203393 RepID=UPI0028121133|nr:acyl-homoserine-lactone synthase [Chelativorans sp.]